tara:strand:- start:232 stop:537 length:306 start_codon:yes stop_codon:yes gene_type:complete
LKKKLKDFSNRLENLKDSNLKTKNQKKNKNSKDFGIYMKSGVELVSAIIVALVIGIFLDNYFQSKPIFLIIFLILGFAAGIMNVFRSVKKLGFEVGFKKKK